jgi:hypothetical protein
MLDDFRFGEVTVRVDCDVLQADRRDAYCRDHRSGGGRPRRLRSRPRGRLIVASPIRRLVAAVSVGLVDGAPRLDLDYEEDVRAGVDMNVVMTNASGFVEVQGTGRARDLRPCGARRAARLGGVGNPGAERASARCARPVRRVSPVARLTRARAPGRYAESGKGGGVERHCVRARVRSDNPRCDRPSR